MKRVKQTTSILDVCKFSADHRRRRSALASIDLRPEEKEHIRKATLVGSLWSANNSVWKCCQSLPSRVVTITLSRKERHCSGNSMFCFLVGSEHMSKESHFLSRKKKHSIGMLMKSFRTPPKWMWLLKCWQQNGRIYIVKQVVNASKRQTQADLVRESSYRNMYIFPSSFVSTHHESQ
jgi:hypothetical protein